MTIMEGYRAAHCFLHMLWDEAQWEELGDILSGMSLLPDNTSADPRFTGDWRDASKQALGLGWSTNLTPEGAFATMTAFLRVWAAVHSDGTIDGLCDSLDETGPERTDWDEAVRQALDGSYDPCMYWITGPLSEREAP